MFAKSYVHDQLAAEDIASDSLIAFWEILNKNEITHPQTFLFSIVKNKSIDVLRKELIHQEALAVMSEVGIREINSRINTLEACDPELIYSDEIQKIIDSTLKSLPEKTRIIFIMSRYQNKSRKEVAQMMNISSKGVEYHLSKALQELRIALKEYLPLFLFFFFY